MGRKLTAASLDPLKKFTRPIDLSWSGPVLGEENALAIMYVYHWSL